MTTVTLISLVGETAMAGAVGAGGIGNVSVAYGFILFKNQIQTTSASACRTQVLPVPSFLVFSLIFIEYKSMVLKFILTNITIKVKKRIFTFISTEKKWIQCF